MKKKKMSMGKLPFKMEYKSQDLEKIENEEIQLLDILEF